MSKPALEAVFASMGKTPCPKCRGEGVIQSSSALLIQTAVCGQCDGSGIDKGGTEGRSTASDDAATAVCEGGGAGQPPVNAAAMSDVLARTRARGEGFPEAQDNPAEGMRGIAEGMVDGVTIKGVDHESFDRGASYCAGPVGDPEVVDALRAAADAGSVFGDWARDQVGRLVEKSGGDYAFSGIVRAVIVKGSGAVRFAVEDDRGLLLIMNSAQTGIAVPKGITGARWRDPDLSRPAPICLNTGDPHFSPTERVLVNGYSFSPTKAAFCQPD